jgi:hypothetical protein
MSISVGIARNRRAAPECLCRGREVLGKEVNTMSNQVNKQYERDLKILAGTDKYLVGVQTLVLNGQSFSVAQVRAAVQARVNATTDAEASKAQTRVKLNARKSASATARPIVAGLEAYVALSYGKRSQAMTDFGFSIPKQPKKSAEEKALAAQRAAATRKARGTMGAKQRKAVKGTVPATTPSTATKPAGQ